ncbi:alpha/beta hydrolase [Salipaludibacillus sp. HK11]|uniref:alpha/beta hydrolase n=1 Tax=Salipaludibacillus sp. HK11 TaxID=3394320 RepID=UPI0039FDA329
MLSPRLIELSTDITENKLVNFWEEVNEKGSPLIEEVNEEKKKLVTFLYKEEDSLENVVVILGPAGLDFKRNKMVKLADTNVWYRSYLLSEDAKFQYLLSPNDSLIYPLDILPDFKKFAEREGNFIKDPLNKHPYPFENPMVSTVGMSSEMKEIFDQNLKGKTEEFIIWSDELEHERKINLYTPVVKNKNEPLPLLVMLDGELNPSILPVIKMVDQLIDMGEIKPISIALIGDGDNREAEFGCNSSFSNFLAYEIMSHLKNRRYILEEGDHCICGFSFAGIGAFYTSYLHSSVFKNVLMVSSSLYWSPVDFNESEYLSWFIANHEKQESNIYIECGKMENDDEFQRYYGGTSNLLTNRHLRNVLQSKGYNLKYHEFNGGHDFIQWIDSLKRGLIYFYGQGRR